eukprot:1157461-Pelagomonas_calceolata.AAC.10
MNSGDIIAALDNPLGSPLQTAQHNATNIFPSTPTGLACASPCYCCYEKECCKEAAAWGVLPLSRRLGEVWVERSCPLIL